MTTKNLILKKKTTCNNIEENKEDKIMKDVKEILKRSEELNAELVWKYSNINNYLATKKQQREEK